MKIHFVLVVLWASFQTGFIARPLLVNTDTQRLT